MSPEQHKLGRPKLFTRDLTIAAVSAAHIAGGFAATAAPAQALATRHQSQYADEKCLAPAENYFNHSGKFSVSKITDWVSGDKSGPCGKGGGVGYGVACAQFWKYDSETGRAQADQHRSELSRPH